MLVAMAMNVAVVAVLGFIGIVNLLASMDVGTYIKGLLMLVALAVPLTLLGVAAMVACIPRIRSLGRRVLPSRRRYAHVRYWFRYFGDRWCGWCGYFGCCIHGIHCTSSTIRDPDSGGICGVPGDTARAAPRIRVAVTNIIEAILGAITDAVDKIAEAAIKIVNALIDFHQ